MKMNKIVLLSVLATSASALLATGPAGCTAYDANFDPVVLTVGTDTAGTLGYVPFEKTSGANISGFDIAVAVEVAHRVGFKSTTFRQIPFSQNSTTNPLPLLSELNKTTSLLDLAVAAISIINRIAPQNAFAAIPLPNVGYSKYADDNFGVILRADATAFSNPATFLKDLNTAAGTGNTVANVLRNSREHITIDGSAGAADPYSQITATAADTLSTVVTNYKANTGTAALPTFLMVDSDTAKVLIADTATFPAGQFKVLLNVVDTFNVSPSQGLGIAVGGATQAGTSCPQLLANVSQALKDMVTDGTLALLRAQFGITSTSADTTIGTVTPTQTPAVTATINSNVIHNFYFTKYGTPVITVGNPITPAP